MTEKPLTNIYVNQRDKQFTQELQLTNRSGGRFTWVLGGYYYNAITAYAPVTFAFFNQGVIATIRSTQKSESIAGYGQATYEVFDQTHLTLGGRYTTEKRTLYDGSSSVFVIPIATQLPLMTAPDRQQRFNKFTFRVSLDHRFSDEVLTYASFNRGFKSGGFNTANLGTDPYRPEQIDAYEVGVKTDLLDRHLRINLAGFYYKYSDIQIQLLQQGSIGIINAASAKVYGLDADFQAVITDRFKLTGGIGLTHPKFGSFPSCQIGTPRGGVPVTVGACDNNQLPLASKVLGNVAATYSLPLVDSSSLTFNGNLYYNDGVYEESDNVVFQKAYVQLGALVTYTAPGGRLSVSGYVKNLTNRRVLDFETTVPNGLHYAYYQAPRTYGATLAFKY